MATGNKREEIMPSQPERLYQGSDKVRDVLYTVMQTNTGKWLVRQRSAARRELQTGIVGSIFGMKYR